MPLYETLATAYDELFPVNPATLDFLESLAPAPPPGGPPRRLLDIGSATGGHVLALAHRGWRATGLEPSGVMVRIAAEAARAAGLEARFIEAGMEELGALFGPDSFELILCLGNTLPHLPSREALADFLAAARRLLVPGGRLVLQLLNYARVGPGSALPELESPGYRFRRRYREGPPGEGRLLFETELEERGGERHRDETLLLPIGSRELGAALSAAGYSRSGSLAAWDASPFREETSPFLIEVAAR